MTNLTDCIRYENDLKAYADSELSWLRRQAVRRHLTHCVSCQEEIIKMVQMTENLRAAEPAAVLPPTLREKILASEPGTGSAGLLVNESASGTEEPSVPGNARKRPLLVWGLAASVLIAWFACYPIYQRNFVNAQHVNRVLTEQADVPPSQLAASPSTLKSKPLPPPKVPPRITVRLSDREAGIADTYSDSNPSVYVRIKNPDGGYQNSLNATANADPDLLRQVHKEASIGIQVPNPEAIGDTLNQMVKETGGYVAANNLTTGDDGLKTGELIVKVPVAQFETFLSQVAKLGTVMSKNISGEDITEKTSDADQTEGVLEDDVQQSEARLKTLGGKAKWRDEEAARDLRIQLAQAQARLVLLKRMSALGTITIDLSQTPKTVVVPPVTNGFTDSLKATTHNALQSLIDSADALLALVIWLLAYVPIWLPLLLLGRYALKEYRKREAA